MSSSTREHNRPHYSLTFPAVIDSLPPLPIIRSDQLSNQIFTHSSLSARSRCGFETPQEDSMRDNEGLAHIGDQILGLAVTDLIQSRHPRLHVGPTSKVRDRVKCRDTLAKIAVQYRLHEMLRSEDPCLRDAPSAQVDIFKAYVAGLFREQGLDVVKRWLEPLFEPLIEDAYWAERRDHLQPEPQAPETPSPTPSPSPPPESVAPAPRLLGRAAEDLNRANVQWRGRPEQTAARNGPMRYRSVVEGTPAWATYRPSGSRARRGNGSRDGGRGDAVVLSDAPNSSYAGWHSSASSRRRKLQN